MFESFLKLKSKEDELRGELFSVFASFWPRRSWVDARVTVVCSRSSWTWSCLDVVAAWGERRSEPAWTDVGDEAKGSVEWEGEPGIGEGAWPRAGRSVSVASRMLDEEVSWPWWSDGTRFRTEWWSWSSPLPVCPSSIRRSDSISMDPK